MPRIYLSVLESQFEFAQQIKTALSGTFESLHIITAQPAQPADLLLVIAGEDWSQQIMQDSVQYELVVSALQRQDIPIVVILPQDTPMPKMTDLPQALHGIAYMKHLNVHTDEARYQADLIQLAKIIDAHINRHKTPASGFPVNLVLFVLIILFSLFIILVPNDDPTVPVDGMNVGKTVQIGVAVSLNPDTIDQGNTLINGLLLALQTRPDVIVDGNRYPVDLITLDTNCTSLGAVRVAEALTADPLLLGVIGPLCEVSCTASASIYETNGYAVISPACQTPNLTTFSTFNRTVPSRTGVAVAAADYAQTLTTPQNTLVIHDEQIIARDLAQAFIAQYPTAPQTITINTTQLDFDALMADILNPQVVYFAGRAATAAELRSRLADDVTLILALPDDDYITFAGQAAEGTLAFELVDPPLDEIATQYAQTFQTPAASPVYAYSYDALNMLMDTIEATAVTDDDGNLIINRASLNAAIRAYSGQGITGALNCNNTGECAQYHTRLIQVQNGGWTHGDGLLD
ncbi:MAG: hypothetical protein Kow00117_21810 [Phototrophicales bacterium]